MSKKTLETFLEEKAEIDYSEIESQYETFLDDCFESVELAGMTIYASEMKNIDPVMFRCGVADFCDENYTEYGGKYYLKSDFEEVENDFSEYLEEEED